MSKKLSSTLKVALAHDYLREYGGAERVVEALHEVFPTAPVYVAFKDPSVTGLHWEKFKDWDIRESWLTKIPLYKKLFSPLRIFAPNYFESFDLSEYDVVISSSNAYFAKAVKVAPNALHVCYCHTPARSLYGYTTATDWQRQPITKFFGSLINHYLRVVDYKVAQRVGYFIANSEEVKRRIWKFYRREATVIYPPVNVPAKLPSSSKSSGGTSGYFLYVNRFAVSKHPDLAIQACNELGLPLKVVGTGKMEEQLRAMSGPTVEFLGAVSDEKLHELYAGASALLYPVEDEDFGIVPIEAMGYGVPVIAHRSGGPQETIVDGKTGVFFDEVSLAGLVAAIHRFQKMKFQRKTIHAHALQFRKENFQKKIQEFVAERLAAK